MRGAQYFASTTQPDTQATILDKNLETLGTFSHRFRPPPFFNVGVASQRGKCRLNTVKGKGVFQGFLARIVGDIWACWPAKPPCSLLSIGKGTKIQNTSILK